MKRQGFSVTTGILIAVLLGALVLVGKVVNPPPPGPPETPPATPVSAPTANDSAKPAPPNRKLAKEEDEKGGPAGMKNMPAEMKKRMEEMKKHPQTKPPAFNPTSVDVTSSYWNENKPGEAGVEAMTEKVAKAKEELARQAAAQKAAGAPPPAAPGK